MRRTDADSCAFVIAGYTQPVLSVASRRWPDNDDTPRATKHDEHRDPPVIPAPELWPARLLQH
jgi:hypothetical protein